MRESIGRCCGIFLGALVALTLLPGGDRPAGAEETGSGPLDYLPLVPMEKTFGGLGGAHPCGRDHASTAGEWTGPGD